MEYRVQGGDTIAKVTRIMNMGWSRLKALNPQAVGRSKENGNWFLKAGATMKDSHSFAFVLEQTNNGIKPSPTGVNPPSRDLPTAHIAKPGQISEPAHNRKPDRMPYEAYTIKPGDTLWALAVKKFHVNMKDIVADNNIENPGLIQPGQTLRIRRPDLPKEQLVTASWYGEKFHGRKMADGKPYNMYGDTIAHKELPFGTKVELENIETGESVMATVTDRGPYVEGRDVDLSYGLAQKLSLAEQGVGTLKMRIL